MAIVVERINQAGHVLHCQVLDKPEITLGRAYTNDVIITDTYIDPIHASISCIDHDEKPFYFTCDDHSSVNGIFDRKGQKQVARSYWQSGQTLMLGKTLLRISSSDTIMPPAIRLSAWEKISDTLSRSRSVILVSILCISLIVVDTYLSMFSVQNKTAEYATVLYILLIIVAYAGFFTFLGKALRQDSRFWLYYTLISISIVFIASYDWVSGFIFFNLNLSISTWFNPIIYALTIALLINYSIHSASSLKALTRIAIASIIPCLIAINLAIDISKSNEFNSRPHYDSSAYFTSLYIARSKTKIEILADAKLLYQSK